MSDDSSVNSAVLADDKKDQASSDDMTTHTSQVHEIENALAETRLVAGTSQAKAQVTVDHLSKEDVQKVIEDYKAEIKYLEEKLKCVSCDETALKVAEENQRLKKRNKVLLATNMDFVTKHATLSKKFEDAEKEIANLVKERENLEAQNKSLRSTVKSDQSQCHPGGDIGGTEAQQKEVDFASASNVATLKLYLSQYYHLLQKSKAENFQLRQAVRHAEMKTLKKGEETTAQEQNAVQTGLLELCKRYGLPVTEQASSSENKQHEFMPAQYKDLLVQLSKKNEELELQIKERDDHIVEQEGKIEKLTIRCGEAENDRNNVTRHPQQSTQSSSENDRLNEVINERNREIQALGQQVAQYEQRVVEMSQEIQKVKRCKSPDASLYHEQLKAFQEDYMAEREEKKRIMEESRRLHEDNQHLRLELQNRSSSQSHFPPALPNSNPPYESMQPITPPISHSQLQPDYPPHMSPSISSHGLQGVMPNTGSAVFNTSFPPEYRRTNTIPPRSTPGHPTQYPYNYPHDQQFYPAPMQNFGEAAREVGQGYQHQGRFCASNNRVPNAVAPQVTPPQDRHGPR